MWCAHTSPAASYHVRSTSTRKLHLYMPVLQFKAEEVQRCVKGIKGKSFEVEVCVATTATYGDKFRVVCRHRQARHPHKPSKHSRLRNPYTVH